MSKVELNNEQNQASTDASTGSAVDGGADFEIEVFYDGDCPLCMREIRMLRRLDSKGESPGAIRFTDIAAPDFDPAAHDRTMDEFMTEIRGRLPDGTWLTGVEVFRRLYGAVGFRRLVALSRWPVVRHALELGYRLFAKNRLRLTGRCSPDGQCRIDPGKG